MPPLTDSTHRLITVESEPFNAETPQAALQAPETPTPLFYVRNHFSVPQLSADDWELALEGLLSRPARLSLAQLQALPQRTLIVTLECAGNGRRSLTPQPPGTPWGYGAVSTARFTGTPLAELLQAARVAEGAHTIVFTGADSGAVAEGRQLPFSRSLPLPVAHHPDTLLAWEMNGAPLTPEHGFPVRLIVPGWYGMASVKWLVGIAATAQPFGGYFQTERYIYQGEQGTPEGTPVSSMRVRSLILAPGPRAATVSGVVEIQGLAWGGAARVSEVAVTVDGGRTWAAADLDHRPSPYAAVAWRYEWRPGGPGEYTLGSRATDALGQTQPRQQRWNALGYGNNAMQFLRTSVA